MKLIGELKERVEKSETKEEARNIIEEVGVVLDDDELDQVSGGFGFFEDSVCDDRMG